MGEAPPPEGGLVGEFEFAGEEGVEGVVLEVEVAGVEIWAAGAAASGGNQKT